MPQTWMLALCGHVKGLEWLAQASYDLQDNQFVSRVLQRCAHVSATSHNAGVVTLVHALAWM